MPEKPKLLARESVHHGRIVDVEVHRVGFEDGLEVELDHVVHPGGAAVVAVDRKGRVALVQQHRHSVGRVLLEVPAGKLGEGEAPRDCAARELEEEAGVRAGRLLGLGDIWTAPGFSNERIWLFYATDLSRGERNLDADERLDVLWISFDEALRLAMEGGIADAKSICALARIEHLLKPV